MNGNGHRETITLTLNGIGDFVLYAKPTLLDLDAIEDRLQDALGENYGKLLHLQRTFERRLFEKAEAEILQNDVPQDLSTITKEQVREIEQKAYTLTCPEQEARAAIVDRIERLRFAYAFQQLFVSGPEGFDPNLSQSTDFALFEDLRASHFLETLKSTQKKKRSVTP